MSDGIYSALSGAIAQQRALDTAANNVANANTTGFRANRLMFGEVLARASANPAPDVLRYTEVTESRTITDPGFIKQTGNPLDLALQGDGFFVVQTPAGERYTRAGSFVADENGELRTPDGFPVLGDGGAFTLPPNAREIVIDPTGTVQAVGSEANAEPMTLGQLKIVRFNDPSTLMKEGATLFNSSGQPVVADDQTTVLQGFLEGANVNAVAGMNELINVSRSFEAFQKVIQTFRQLDEQTAREVGRR
jgi:flagellar basal-body rod protein FlgF